MSTAKNVLLWNYHIIWIERILFGKPFEISLVTSLHDWFTLGALAADKNFILGTL